MSYSVNPQKEEQRLAAGDSSALGARWDGEGVLFSVYSEHAEMLELCVFNESNHEIQRLSFNHCDTGVWHGYLPGLAPGARYGFRAHGAFDPENGHYFNPQRLLLDPYARAITGGYRVSPANSVCRFENVDGESPQPMQAFSFAEDNADFVGRSVVLADSDKCANSASVFPKPSRRVIYEAHLAGLTALNASIPSELRGKFAGAGRAEIISHLRALGVTSLQLLPVQAFVDEPHLAKSGLNNYWGYNTLSFFAPHLAYAQSPHAAHQEMKSLVRALHDANIEVLMDVVYNHTAEGGADGPSLSFRGLDNSTYYKLDPAAQHAYINDTGCGNTLDTNHPVVQNLVRDSLRHWSSEYGVDGYRFDLAVSLGREPEGFSAQHPLFEALRTDDVLSEKLLIAEPWDIGPGGYQLGSFGQSWLEWNDKFRDAARSYWRGDAGAQAELGKRLHGSSDLFESSGRTPSASVNFITAHDGFTLADLVAFEEKHNEANLEDNRDGHGHNLSDNLGCEGPTNDPFIGAARDRRSRALLATMVLSQGTPMLLAGDELKNSQDGNNNAYCQNNAIGWVQWDQASSGHINLISRLVDLRSTLDIYRQSRHVHDDYQGGADDQSDSLTESTVGWRCFDGAPMTESHWHSYIKNDETIGSAAPFALFWATACELLVLALNPLPNDEQLLLPAGHDWRAVLDTSHPSGQPVQPISVSTDGATTQVPAQSLCVFLVATSRGAVTEASE